MKRVLVGCLVLVAAVGALFGAGAPAFAHTQLDFTLPAEGTTVGDPVTQISIGFTGPVSLIGNGFEVRVPNGTVLEPFAVTDDNMVFRLQFDPPLAGGSVGVRYTVTAEDGHPLEGSFLFEVAAAPPTQPVTAATQPAESTAESTVGSTVVSTVAATPNSAGVSTTAVLTLVNAADDSGDDDSNRNTVIVGAAAVAVVALAFLAVRSRRGGINASPS